MSSIVMNTVRRPWALMLLVAAMLVAGAATMRAAALAAGPAYLANFPNFASTLSPALPGDVDTALKARLETAQLFPQVQREFDLYSWQMFLSLAWPTNNAGMSAPRLTDTGFGAPRWTLWHNSSQVFRTDGARPAACGASGGRALLAAPPRDASLPVSKGLRAFSVQNTASADPRGTRLLGVMSAVGELNATNLSETGQAFTGPMIDQNGEFVFYEIMIDPNETNYLCQTGLYNINGQLLFNAAGRTVAMPSGSMTSDWSGSFELKFAWRIMKPGVDDLSRFFTQPAVVMDQGPNGQPVERRVTVGLVGMHIAHKTASSPQWIWSTFEQVDNLAVDAVAHPKLRASFNDPGCAICAVDQQPQANAQGVYPRIPTQAWRAIPIPPDKQALNAQVATALKAMGSVWQYYQLIDTQWPTDPSAKPSPWNGPLPDAVTNKAGGQVTPTFLTNITMETYFQGGNQPACRGVEAPTGAPCPASYTGKTPVQAASAKPAFMTESCTGCHSSAGIYKTYDKTTGQGKTTGQLTADFSWLPAQKAAYAKTP